MGAAAAAEIQTCFPTPEDLRRFLLWAACGLPTVAACRRRRPGIRLQGSR